MTNVSFVDSTCCIVESLVDAICLTLGLCKAYAVGLCVDSCAVTCEAGSLDMLKSPGVELNLLAMSHDILGFHIDLVVITDSIWGSVLSCVVRTVECGDIERSVGSILDPGCVWSADVRSDVACPFGECCLWCVKVGVNAI